MPAGCRVDCDLEGAEEEEDTDAPWTRSAFAAVPEEVDLSRVIAVLGKKEPEARQLEQDRGPVASASEAALEAKVDRVGHVGIGL